MVINFVGNFQNGYVGEVGDATHLVREMESLGHKVRRIPQDEWREHVIDEKEYPNVPKDMKADINIICKWHHFYDGRFIRHLGRVSEAPVFYWVWDFMDDQGFPDWHLKAIEAADLYLGNDVRNPKYRAIPTNNLYYFPFDVADANIPRYQTHEKKYDVSFFGSWIGQGDRQSWLTAISNYIHINVFSWNYKDWPLGFDVSPAVYGKNLNRAISQSKIILGFNVEPSCWGYWSNRVGKTLLAGGFLLQQYAPGMELFFGDGMEYFSTIEELKEKIDFYLLADTERENIARNGWFLAQDRFSSSKRVRELIILIERYLKERGRGWSI